MKTEAPSNEPKESAQTTGGKGQGQMEDVEHVFRSDLRVHFLIKGILLTKGIGTMKELICQEFEQKYGIRPIKEDIYLKKCANGSMTAYVGFWHDYEAYKVLTSEARIQLPLVGRKGETGAPQCEVTELFRLLLAKLEPELRRQAAKVGSLAKPRAEDREHQRWKYSRDYARHLSRSRSFERRVDRRRSRSRSRRRDYEEKAKGRSRSRSRDNSYERRKRHDRKYEEHRENSNKKADESNVDSAQRMEEGKEPATQTAKTSREDGKSSYCCYLINIPKDVDERQVRQEFDKLKLPHPRELEFTQQSTGRNNRSRRQRQQVLLRQSLLRTQVGH